MLENKNAVVTIAVKDLNTAAKFYSDTLGLKEVDKEGKTVISGKFTYASSFSGGLARFETLTKDGLLWGYVDEAGKLVWGPAK